MLVENQEIKIKWSHANKKHYQEKGYIFTKYGDFFKVKAEDLTLGAEVDVKIICDFCNKEYLMKWHRYVNIKSKNEKCACYNCRHIKRYTNDLKRRQESLYIKALEACKKRGYILLSKQEDIINNTTYVEYLCPIHGKQNMRISNLINGKGCPDCVPLNNNKRFQLSSNEVEKRIGECGGTWFNKGEYKNRSERNLIIGCPECGKQFVTSLVLFTQHGGQLCDNCSGVESIGEKRIRHYLEGNKIKFQQEKWFSDCRDINPLPFDFYLYEYNIIIEFDGRQHFEETDHFTYSFETVRKHDLIKNQYCVDNNIKLIRIPYWKITQIEEILNDELILHKDIV